MIHVVRDSQEGCNLLVDLRKEPAYGSVCFEIVTVPFRLTHDL